MIPDRLLVMEFLEIVRRHTVSICKHVVSSELLRGDVEGIDGGKFSHTVDG